MGENHLELGEQFTRLLLENRKRIFGFVLSLMPSGSDVDDVFQNACAVMWRKFDQFESGTNFAAWALQIARYEVMDHYAREKRRTARLPSTPGVLRSHRLGTMRSTPSIPSEISSSWSPSRAPYRID